MAKRGRPRYPDLLTPREQEVLALIRDGLTNPQIAERLGIGVEGVKYHVSEILGKLGVASREEAALWREDARPWWLGGAIAMWRPPLRAASIAAAGVLVVCALAGLALLAFLLVRGGHNNGVSTNVVGTAVGTPTPTVTFVRATPLPLPTLEPFVATPADCPGVFAEPEAAIAACIRRTYQPDYSYVGDCDRPIPAPPGQGLDRPCSSWEDSSGTLRSYTINDVGADAFDRLIVQQSAEGWSVTMKGGCAIQAQIDRDGEASNRASEIRSGDCRLVPQPLTRPTLHVGDYRPTNVENGRTRLGVGGATYHTSRGLKLQLQVTNISGATLPWISDVGADIRLTGVGGDLHPTEVGGSLAVTAPDGLPEGSTWYGWLVFSTEQLGQYILHYPNQPEIALDLTADQYDESRRAYFQNLKQ